MSHWRASLQFTSLEGQTIPIEIKMMLQEKEPSLDVSLKPVWGLSLDLRLSWSGGS